MVNLDAALVQEILYVAQRERETDVEHHRQEVAEGGMDSSNPGQAGGSQGGSQGGGQGGGSQGGSQPGGGGGKKN